MTGNLYDALPERLPDEVFETLAESGDVTIERIVSTGQATPDGEWMSQDRQEWVVLLRGEADLSFDDETAPRRLGPGDYVLIPEGARHRVEWTSSDESTVWLAVHFR